MGTKKRTFESWELEQDLRLAHHRAKYVKEDEKEGYFTLSGGADTLILDIPFPHRLVRIEMCFDDATARDIDLYLMPKGYPSLPYPPRIYSKTGATFKDTVLEFTEGYERALSPVIKFVVTGTASKKFYPIVYIQKMGKG